ncbi:hypothetical protein SAMN05880592_10121 [Bosea sp. TND4EK4]|nr:hypothetical protein SAMN05880592_10121 [Bosea sp. TND4EK4]
MMTSQDGAHPCENLAQVERLGDVVIGTNLKPDDTINHLIPSRQHDDRNVGSSADFARERQAIIVSWQDQIEKDQVNRPETEFLPQALAIRSDTDLIPGFFQIATDHLADTLIVIDDQNTLTIARQINHRPLRAMGSMLQIVTNRYKY